MSQPGRRTLGQRAIVLGGSMAGLLAARVLSEFFDEVVLVERDPVEDRPETRKGQPQTRHVHGLLASGLDSMSRLFPDLVADLRQGGAILADMGTAIRWFSHGGYRVQSECGLVGALVSRAFLEWQIRRRVLTRTNVTVRDRCDAAGLLPGDDGRRVTGVRLVHRAEGGRSAECGADLVMDATGRGSAAPRWLEAMGYDRPPERAMAVGVGYASRVYRRNPGDLAGARCVMINAHPPHQKRSGFLLPWEGERWIVTLAGYFGDHAPTDESGFVDYARSLAAPDIGEVIPRLEPLTEIYTHGFPSNLRRGYEKMTRFPEGYLVCGDALCSFNPVFGQGMTTAAMQAEVLAGVLAGRVSLDGVWKEFFRRAAGVLETPWNLVVGEDTRFPEARRGSQGGRGVMVDVLQSYIDAAQRATHRDPIVYRAFLEVMNLKASPARLFAPGVLWRVFRDALRGRKGRSA